MADLLGADGALVLYALRKLQLPFQIVDVRLRDLDASPGDRQSLLIDLEVGAQAPHVQLEQGITRPHHLPRGDEDLGDDSAQGGADGDVLRAGFHQADRRHRVRKVRDGGWSRRIGALWARIGPGNRNRRPESGQDTNQGQDESFHASLSLSDDAEASCGRTSTIRPSSMWAILSA